jgi:hypothetical protein
MKKFIEMLRSSIESYRQIITFKGLYTPWVFTYKEIHSDRSIIYEIKNGC